MSGQDVFAGALFDPVGAVPPGVQGRGGTRAGRRFDVYRNNVVAGLVAALEVGFPVVRALVGEAFFKAMAGAFVRRHPPRSPRMMLYGAELAGFLEDFPPVRALPYLPDVARLEYLLRESYHAADAAAVDPQALAAVPPDRLPELRFGFAPSMRLLRSDWPVGSIWHAHHGGAKPASGAEAILIARLDFDPVPHVVPPGGIDLIEALLAGETLGRAVGRMPPDFQESKISTVLGLLLNCGAISRLEMEERR